MLLIVLRTGFSELACPSLLLLLLRFSSSSSSASPPPRPLPSVCTLTACIVLLHELAHLRLGGEEGKGGWGEGSGGGGAGGGGGGLRVREEMEWGVGGLLQVMCC